MDDLLAEFVAESREMLEALGSEIVAWESNPGDRDRLDSIFRFVHTVKGNCGFFDFPRLQALSHAAEDALADVRAGRRHADGALVTAVLAIIDRISDMVTAIDDGVEFSEGGDERLIRALQPATEITEAPELNAPVTVDDRQPRAVAQRTVRLPLDLLDRVMSSVSDMVLARNELAHGLREASIGLAVNAPFERLSAIIAEVRDAITRTRMQRVEHLFTPLPRLIRDLSAELGKQVMVDVEGGDVELDREMIEMIRDPLTHIIRNAVDHGIEAPGQRLAAGKREIGLLTISARQSGNHILIDVVDDGRGIDDAAIVEKAIAQGIVTAAEGAALSLHARYQLIFEAGLSTARSVTAISGRGVGMDVVRSNVERVGGAIEIDSLPGQGTRMTLRVPLTLSIIPALTASVGDLKFAIPRSSIEEIVHAGGDAVEMSRIGDKLLAMIRNRRVPCLALSNLLELDGGQEADMRTLVVLRLAGGDFFALAVDRLHDHEELVVKPIAPALMATGLYAGTTLTDDGRPILLLDVPGLARAGGLSLDVRGRSAPVSISAEQVRQARTTPVLLFTAMDGRRQAMRMAIVEHIEEVEPRAAQMDRGEWRVVVGERILPLLGMEGASLPDKELRLFRLSDGGREIGYAFRDVIDIKAIEDDIVGTGFPGEVEGITLIDGEPAEVVDPHWLFAHCPVVSAPDEQAVCRLSGSDPWVQNFLRPIVEAAGYRVVDEHDEDEADVAIALEDTAEEVARAARVIWLRTNPEDVPETTGQSIYRYDRDGLMEALKAASGGQW